MSATYLTFDLNRNKSNKILFYPTSLQKKQNYSESNSMRNRLQNPSMQPLQFYICYFCLNR